MKVLFVSSGRSGGTGIVVRNQGDSLKAAGIALDYYCINPGFAGYLSAVSGIRGKFREGGYDLIHAHYGLSAMAASLAGRYPLVVSLMGSDAFMSGAFRLMLRFLSRFRWDATIVKTEGMKRRLKMSAAEVIPNGVDTERFKPSAKPEARDRVGYSAKRKLILFASDPDRKEKNYSLAAEAVRLVNNPEADLKLLYDIPNSDMPLWLNAADLLLVTSFREGSPNIVKEAMACCCPIVSTDVGDVAAVMDGLAGCYITSADASDIALKIQKVLESGERTNGRERIMTLGLDAKKVAEEIISVYEKVVS